jgi:hypothetical protein
MIGDGAMQSNFSSPFKATEKRGRNRVVLSAVSLSIVVPLLMVGAPLGASASTTVKSDSSSEELAAAIVPPAAPSAGFNIISVSAEEQAALPLSVSSSDFGSFTPEQLSLVYELDNSGKWLPFTHPYNYSGDGEVWIVDGVEYGESYTVRVKVRGTVAGISYDSAPSAPVVVESLWGWQDYSYKPQVKVTGSSATISWDLRKSLRGQPEGGANWRFGDQSGPAETVGSVTLDVGYNTTEEFRLFSPGMGGDHQGFHPVTIVTGPPAATIVAGIPTLTGTAKVGKALTVAPGTWGPGAVSLSIRWARDGVPIPGATGKTYFVQKADVGKVITSVVTGSKQKHPSVTATTPGTAPVVPK